MIYSKEIGIPTYCFRNKSTGEVTEKLMSYSSRQGYLEQNPDLEVIVGGAPALGDPVRLGLKKPDAGFRDVLKNIKSKHRGATINTW